MSPARKDPKMGMGTIREFIRVAFHFACVLTVMSLLTVPLVKRGTAEYYVLMLTLIINGITVAGILLSKRLLDKLMAKSETAQEEDNDVKK